MKIISNLFLGIFISALISPPLTAQNFSKYFTTANLDTIKKVRNTQYYNYADIGEIETTNKIKGSHANSYFEHALNNYDITNVKELVPNHAVDRILEMAAQEQIIIINEMHHTPQHRVFTKQLLDGLWDRGYRYFGLEALANNNYSDSILQNNAYPTQIAALPISYIEEPQFAELLRHGFRKGFTIFPYERTEEQRAVGRQLKDKLYRDFTQATNIMAVLKKDPKAKILIHCGYAHAVETIQAPTHNWGKEKWMAAFLKEFSGIDPLTIDQTILTERRPLPDNPFYYTKEVDTATLFEDEFGFPFRPNTFFATDLYVWHPRTQEMHGRPHWLVQQPGYATADISFIKENEFPFLVLAQYAEEKEDAVPVDVFEVNSKDDLAMKKLVLKIGYSYRIYTKNKYGEVKQWETIKLK